MTAPCQNLLDEAGFEALLDAVKVKCARVENVVVWVYAPKPSSSKSDTDDIVVCENDTYSLLT